MSLQRCLRTSLHLLLVSCPHKYFHVSLPFPGVRASPPAFSRELRAISRTSLSFLWPHRCSCDHIPRAAFTLASAGDESLFRKVQLSLPSLDVLLVIPLWDRSPLKQNSSLLPPEFIFIAQTSFFITRIKVYVLSPLGCLIAMENVHFRSRAPGLPSKTSPTAVPSSSVNAMPCF